NCSVLAKTSGDKNEGDNHVQPEDHAPEDVACAGVPADEKPPAQPGNQHDDSDHDQRGTCFARRYREIITAFRIVVHSFHGFPPQITRTSLRSFSTNFFATSAGEPSSISVFLLFCGM